MTFEIHNMDELLAQREARLDQIRQRAERLLHKANRAVRYLRLFGNCLSENRNHAIREHLDELLKAHNEAVSEYETALEAPLSTFAGS